MKISDLLFIGLKGSVVALNRATGEKVWATHLKGYDFVSVVLEDDRLYATSYGEVFCLDPFTGEGLWHNQLKSFGTGLASITTGTGQSCEPTAAVAEKRRRDQEAASSAAVVSAIS